jgi:hypothetical protein
MSERERLRKTGSMPGVQALLEWYGMDVSQALGCSNWIASAVTNGIAKQGVGEVFAICESPAERQFLAGFFLSPSGLGITDASPETLYFEQSTDTSHTILSVTPQFEVCDDALNTIARVDFRLSLFFRNVRAVVLVEIDGHDYHERSKEQASADRARERAIMLQNPRERLMRFTGSEVFADPMGCLDQALRFLIRICETDQAREKIPQLPAATLELEQQEAAE